MGEIMSSGRIAWGVVEDWGRLQEIILVLNGILLLNSTSLFQIVRTVRGLRHGELRYISHIFAFPVGFLQEYQENYTGESTEKSAPLGGSGRAGRLGANYTGFVVAALRKYTAQTARP
jgi:hypothetical protein